MAGACVLKSFLAVSLLPVLLLMSGCVSSYVPVAPAKRSLQVNLLDRPDLQIRFRHLTRIQTARGLRAGIRIDVRAQDRQRLSQVQFDSLDISLTTGDGRVLRPLGVPQQSTTLDKDYVAYSVTYGFGPLEALPDRLTEYVAIPLVDRGRRTVLSRRTSIERQAVSLVRLSLP
jgi:hypothetical protein